MSAFRQLKKVLWWLSTAPFGWPVVPEVRPIKLSAQEYFMKNNRFSLTNEAAGLFAADQYTDIVSAIISMAHSMGLKVIAEGVETGQQLNILQDLQCNEIQGFLFSPPVPQEEATALLDQNMASRLQTTTARQTKSG